MMLLLIIVVSEETGTISVAQRGFLRRRLTMDELRSLLVKGLRSTSVADVNPNDREEDEEDQGRIEDLFE